MRDDVENHEARKDHLLCRVVVREHTQQGRRAEAVSDHVEHRPKTRRLFESARGDAVDSCRAARQLGLGWQLTGSPKRLRLTVKTITDKV